jgi:hypothetical protein
MTSDSSPDSLQAQVEYLRRSFAAVDGLWFVKAEEILGREGAMDLDEKVWRVMGKIQARQALKSLCREERTLENFQAALRLKYAAEGYQAEITPEEQNNLKVCINQCPWLKILEKAGRTELGAEIAEKICRADYEGWAGEFGKSLEFEPESGLCGRGDCCEIVFR